MSSILAGKLRLKPQLVDLIPLVQRVTATLRKSAACKQIQLSERLPDVIQGKIVVDGDRLQQIVTILLDNAIKFTPAGGQITLRLECYGAAIHIAMSNTGIGIPPDFLPYVFDRFRQSRTSDAAKGVGVGLADMLRVSRRQRTSLS